MGVGFEAGFDFEDPPRSRRFGVGVGFEAGFENPPRRCSRRFGVGAGSEAGFVCCRPPRPGWRCSSCRWTWRFGVGVGFEVGFEGSRPSPPSSPRVLRLPPPLELLLLFFLRLPPPPRLALVSGQTHALGRGFLRLFLRLPSPRIFELLLFFLRLPPPSAPRLALLLVPLGLALWGGGGF